MQAVTISPFDTLAPFGLGAADRDALCTLLAAAPFFDNLSPQEQRLLLPFLQGYRAPAGAIIAAEDSPRALGVLLEGEATLYRPDASGTRQPARSIVAGMCFGEAALVDDLPSPEHVVAATDATLVLLSRDSLRRLAASHAVLGVRILHKVCRALCRQLREVRGPVVEYMG